MQAALDRLLRTDAGESLMDGATMTTGPVTNGTVSLKFEKPDAPGDDKTRRRRGTSRRNCSSASSSGWAWAARTRSP